MYKDLQRTCIAIGFLIKPFVWWRFVAVAFVVCLIISDWKRFLDPTSAYAITKECPAQCLDAVYLTVTLLVIDYFEGLFYDWEDSSIVIGWEPVNFVNS